MEALEAGNLAALATSSLALLKSIWNDFLDRESERQAAGWPASPALAVAAVAAVAAAALSGSSGCSASLSLPRLVHYTLILSNHSSLPRSAAVSTLSLRLLSLLSSPVRWSAQKWAKAISVASRSQSGHRKEHSSRRDISLSLRQLPL